MKNRQLTGRGRALALFAVSALVIVIGSPVAAEDRKPLSDMEGAAPEIAPYNAAIQAFLDEREARTVDEITIGELRQLGAELSVISQEVQYVRRARIASRVIPGAGHFTIDENGRGTAFLAGSIAVSAGTLIGAYFVLPDGVQFHQVDYINDSFREIGEAWRGESVRTLFPAFAVLVGGGALQAVLGELASRDAGRRAQAQIDAGVVQFEPQPFIGPDAEGRLMLGARVGF